MRKSVENRRRAQQAQAATKPFWYRHLWSMGIVLITVLLTVGFISYANWRQITDAKAAKEAQTKQFQALDQQIKATLQKKVDDARKAEAAARATAEAETATRKAAAVANPSGTTAPIKACDVTNPASMTIVVNKKHCFNPPDWAPNDLASVNGFMLRQEVADAMTSMMSAASTAGVGFDLSSAYRSYVNQQVTYNNWVQVNGSQAAADTVSARPGYSEHQTGLAADLKVGSCVLECFGGSAAHAWLRAHAAEYGFIERYPPGLTSITGYSPEAWHWRYVGTATAKDMKAKGIETLEEYFGISGGDYAS